MSRKKNGTSSWRWERWISAQDEPVWAWRLESLGTFPWSTRLRPGRRQLLLEAYFAKRAEAEALQFQWGGSLRRVSEEEWLRPLANPPLRIGTKLLLVAEEKQRQALRGKKREQTLVIPAGLAFGSGEHATTGMLLRALSGEKARSWPYRRVHDLGTGSGVLALAARFWGAEKVGAIDFDPEAIRTARANEQRNFPSARIQWFRADVLTWRPPFRADLVLANLFSGLLIQAAPEIMLAVVPGGKLWLSGILREQEQEVVQVYSRLGWKKEGRRLRGKWLLLQGRCQD